MTTFQIFLIVLCCFSQIIPFGLGHKSELTLSDDLNPSCEASSNVLRLYKEQDPLHDLPSSCPTFSYANFIYSIKVFGLEPFNVLCNSDPGGPGWTVIASRSNKELNFFRGWQDYKDGFGSLEGDFFIGLEKLHAITVSEPQLLYIYLEDFDGTKRFAKYDDFLIGTETDKYKLAKLGTYVGNMGDSLSELINMKFTTPDSDNDMRKSMNCAIEHMGPWWHNDCTTSNLFGLYLNISYKSMYWSSWRGYYHSLKEMRMMVKPKCSCALFPNR